MHDYFSVPTKDQKKIIEVAALKMGVDPILIEKDLWVTITLHALFSNTMPNMFVLKGDTSLSKAFSIIERFSENVEVTIDKSSFGINISLSELATLDKTELEDTLKNIYHKAEDYIHSQLIPLLAQKLKEITKQEIHLTVSQENPLSVELLYPSLFHEKYIYTKPKIDITFSILEAFEPFTSQMVTSYVHKEIKALKGMHVDVRATSPLRTLFEKATLLHMEANRPIDMPIPLRLSRHYYDLHQLITKGYLKDPLKNVQLLKELITYKQMLFSSPEAKYEEIFKHGIKLLPDEPRIKELTRDYKKMTEMFFGQPPSFDQILSALEELERDINIAIEKSTQSF